MNPIDLTFEGEPTIKEIKRKIKAYKDLFDITPNLYVRGYIKDIKGETAFLDYEHKVQKIGSKTLTIVVDNSSDKYYLDGIKWWSLTKGKI